MNAIDQYHGDRFTMYQGDCVEIIQQIPDDSIHYSIFSPPFASLYTYSDSERDMGNCRDEEEFFQHFAFLAPQLYRILKPGRLLSFHCMDIPAMKERDGWIGLKDFPAQMRQAFEDAGFIYHSRATIWKDPLVEATRTKALGLMHKQLVKDSAMCRQGLPDYLITMRKPGSNPEPVAHPNGLNRFIGENEPTAPKHEATLRDSRANKSISMSKEDPVYSHHVWRRYASPVWMDINQSNTLQRESAREEKDERHICPLQLDVIGRGIELWTNPGDIVFSPFAGIGSEIYQAILMDRFGLGIEIKGSYYIQAVANCVSAQERAAQITFDDICKYNA